jgi:hypothetical protein
VRPENDFSAQAGRYERATLELLGFVTEVNKKPIAVGNGLASNGFLTKAALKALGVPTYVKLWGANGRALKQCTSLSADKLEAAISNLKEVVDWREKDNDKWHAINMKKGTICKNPRGCTPDTCSTCDHLQHGNLIQGTIVSLQNLLEKRKVSLLQHPLLVDNADFDSLC